MSQPEYYDGIDSYLYSLVHYATNTENLNPTTRNQLNPIQTNLNNYQQQQQQQQQSTTPSFYPLQQSTNKVERRTNPEDEWPVELGRYYTHEQPSTYNSNNWIQRYVADRRAGYIPLNQRETYNYYNYNAFQPNYYDYRFSNDPYLGHGNNGPFRSFSNKNAHSNKYWQPNNQRSNNNPAYNKPPPSPKAKNNYGKSKKRVKKRSPKKKNKSFNSANDKNVQPETQGTNNSKASIPEKLPEIAAIVSVPSTEKADSPQIVDNTRNLVQNNEISTTDSGSVLDKKIDSSENSVKNNIEIINQEIVHSEETLKKDAALTSTSQDENYICDLTHQVVQQSTKQMSSVDSGTDKSGTVVEIESNSNRTTSNEHKENFENAELFVIDTEADYSFLERDGLVTTPTPQVTTSSEFIPNIVKNQTLIQSESPDQNLQIEKIQTFVTPNKDVNTTLPERIPLSTKKPKNRGKRRREKLRKNKLENCSQDIKKDQQESPKSIPKQINESPIIVIDSDSDVGDSVIEIPRTPAPLIVITDSDDESVSKDQKEMEKPTNNEQMLCTPKKTTPQNDSDTLILHNETDEIFATPESMKRTKTTTPRNKQRKKNKKLKQQKRKFDQEYPSRISTPDSRCSYDDFMQNDICLQDKRPDGDLGRINSHSLEDITNVYGKNVHNISSEIISETESSCCSDWIDKSQGNAAPLTFENIVQNYNNEKRSYKELDLNQFANMITPNRPSASTLANMDLIVPTRASKSINKNTTAISFGADDSHKIIKTKKRNYVDTESSSDESEISQNPKRKTNANGNLNRKQQKNKNQGSIAKNIEGDKKFLEDEEVSTIIEQPKETTLSISNLTIEYNKFLNELGTTNCTETTIDSTDMHSKLSENRTNECTVVCISDESASECNIISTDSEDEENCTIILNTNIKNQPRASEEDCLNNIKSPKKTTTGTENVTNKKLTELTENCQKRAANLKMRFNTYWTPDRNEFYNKSWGGENYDHHVERTLMPNSLNDWMIPDDNHCDFIIRDLDISKRCFNCRQRGHEKKDCQVPIKACGMCGSRKHHAMRCTETCCLTCYSAQKRAFVLNCNKCKRWLKLKCPICNSLGHIGDVCPDMWRRYHLTTQEGEIVRPKHKNTRKQWCSVCARSGHSSENCRYYFNIAKCPPDPMTIQNYSDLYQSGNESPKKRKIDESNSSDLWDIHKLTSVKSNESFIEIDSNGHTKEIYKTESTPPKQFEPCTSSENAKTNLTRNKNNNISEKSDNLISKPEEFNVYITTADAASFNSDTGKKFMAELHEKYSANLQVESGTSSNHYHILKVKCLSKHSKVINVQIRKFINSNNLKDKQWKKIKSDFVMLPRIFQLKNPHNLWKRLLEINRKLKKQQNKTTTKYQKQKLRLEKTLSAFLIGKEKIYNEKRAVHCLSVLQKFFARDDNKNLNNEVILAHNFIFLNTSLSTLLQKWDAQHICVKTTEINDKDASTETTETMETMTNEDFVRYADKLLMACRNNRFLRQLTFAKKKISLNKLDNNTKKNLLRIGRIVKVPYTIANNEKL